MKIRLPHITFEITSVCNLNCRYCYNIWKMPGTKNNTQFNSYTKAKNTLARLFKIADVDSVAFTGGEPLMAERFAEVVLYTRMQKKRVTIISNGNSDSAMYRQLADLGVELFELPLHSPDAGAHDYMTNVSGSWEKSVRSVSQLISLGAYVVGVIVITKVNFKQIADTLLFMKQLGIKRVMLNRFNVGGKGIEEKDNLTISHTELSEAFMQADEVARIEGMSISSNVCTPRCVVDPSGFKSIRFTACSPDVTKRPVTLDIYGNIRFCNHSPTVLGNIFEESLDTIFKTENANLWSTTVPDFCLDCKVYERCMAGCRAASAQLHLSLNEPDPIIMMAGYDKQKFI